jgi:hypothetical protein
LIELFLSGPWAFFQETQPALNEPEPSCAVYLAHCAVRLPLSLIGVAAIFILRSHPRIMRPFRQKFKLGKALKPYTRFRQP